MRGLEEIKHINEHPEEARKDDAVFAKRSRERVAQEQRAHGERVEARHRLNQAA